MELTSSDRFFLRKVISSTQNPNSKVNKYASTIFINPNLHSSDKIHLCCKNLDLACNLFSIFKFIFSFNSDEIRFNFEFSIEKLRRFSFKYFFLSSFSILYFSFLREISDFFEFEFFLSISCFSLSPNIFFSF